MCQSESVTHTPLSVAMLVAINRTLGDLKSQGQPISPAELQRRTGIPDKTLRRKLVGQTEMDPDSFELICDAIGMDVDAMWARARAVQRETSSVADHSAAIVADPEVDAARKVMRQRKVK